MNRISILAITNAADDIAEYVIHIIKELKKHSEIIIVVNKKYPEKVYNVLSEYTDKIISSDGIHYTDLYKDGLKYIGSSAITENTEQILFLNDSFFGPFCSFKEIFDKAEKELPDADLWSLTGITDTSDEKCDSDPFFLAVNNKENTFANFPANKLSTGSEKEFTDSLCKLMAKDNLKSGCLYDLNGKSYSLRHNHLKAVLSGLPVLRVSALTDNFSSTLSAGIASDIKEAIGYISANTPYNTDFIYNYAITVTDPFELLSVMGNHFIVSENGELAYNPDALMVFHAHYDDLIDENLYRLNDIAKICNILITTTSLEKQNYISEKIKNYKYLYERNTAVLLSEGNGRDMAGLLVEARPYLEKYKYIGFTHDKKSAHHQQASGEAFKDIITENIIGSAGYVKNVLSLFESNERLGLLVPPPPEHGKYFAVIGRRWCENFDYYEKLCKKLGIEVNTKPECSSFALGTAFWCRYDALKDLFTYDWEHCDFPPEPLPLNGSISHAVERCFPYVAKKNRYLCGFIYSEKMASTYLNMREYMLTDFMTMMHRRISTESHSLLSYEAAVSKAIKEKPTNKGTGNRPDNYKAHSFTRGIKRSISRKINAPLIKKNSNTRILVILHLFYMNSWKEIKEYLKNLDSYKYDLIVTYTSDMVDEKELADILKYKPSAVLKECENKGYDVGSFTEVLSETRLSDYDIIFKLQSKGVTRPKIYIYGNYFKKRDWFLNLFEGCLGAFNVHKTIDRLMNDKKIGLVAAENLIVPDPAHKQNMVKAFMNERNIKIPEKYLFVAGTCFAVRSELMQPIKEMNLRVKDYTSAGNEFSLAHKMERLVCLIALCGGCDFYGNRVLSFRRALRKLNPDYFIRKKYTGMRLLKDKRFTLDDEFVFFSLEHRLVRKYELIDIPLKDITRRWNNDIIPLTECHPYKYLISKDPSVYDEYCRLNKKLYGLDIMSRERFDKLIESIEKNGFDNNNAVILTGDNILIDGQHRCCYMLYKHGEDYKIPCVRLYEMSNLKNRIVLFLKKHLSEKTYERIKSVYKRFF